MAVLSNRFGYIESTFQEMYGLFDNTKCCPHMPMHSDVHLNIGIQIALCSQKALFVLTSREGISRYHTLG